MTLHENYRENDVYCERVPVCVCVCVFIRFFIENLFVGTKIMLCGLKTLFNLLNAQGW